MRLFYDPNIIEGASEFQLSEEESKHIVKVLRLKTGDDIALVNGNGDYFSCRIISDHPKKCIVQIIDHQKEESPDYSIHIAIAPTKQQDRIEWFIEKATEIGITEISLIQCKNSERIKMKPDRLEKKAISAMKQSKRLYLPVINPLVNFDDFIVQHKNGLIAHCYNDEKQPMDSVFKRLNCPILIGPEGDFSKEELDLALQNGYKTITLGENRLRTETAALYACTYAKIIIDQ